VPSFNKIGWKLWPLDRTDRHTYRHAYIQTSDERKHSLSRQIKDFARFARSVNKASIVIVKWHQRSQLYFINHIMAHITHYHFPPISYTYYSDQQKWGKKLYSVIRTIECLIWLKDYRWDWVKDKLSFFSELFFAFYWHVTETGLQQHILLSVINYLQIVFALFHKT